MKMRQGVAEVAHYQALAEQEHQNAISLQAQGEQRNRDLADQNTIQELMKTPDTASAIASGDMGPLNGKVQPQTVEKMQTSVLNHHKELATATKTDLENRSTALGTIADTAAGLKQLGDPSKINAALPAAIQQLAPQLAILKMDPSKVPTSISSIDDLDQWLAGVGAAKAANDKVLATKESEQKLASGAATMAKTQADTAKTNMEMAGTVPISPQQQAQLDIQKIAADRAAAQLVETQRHNTVEEKQGAGRLGVSQQEQSIKNKTFNATFGAGLDANGHPLPPDELKIQAQQDPVAVGIASYDLAPPSSRTTPLGIAMMRKVMAINPAYDATTFPARNKTATDFSAAGTSGKAITSADTALAHLNTLSKAGKALDNGDVQIINRIANSVGAQVGATPKITYDTILNMVAPEISKAVIGASGGEGERLGMAKNFGSDLGSNAREGAIGAAATLLGARVDKQKQAYESTMGKPLSRKLSPESEEILQKYKSAGPGAGGGHRIKVGGKLYDYKGTGNTADLANYTEVKQ